MYYLSPFGGFIQGNEGFNISIPTWDKWAAAAYLLTIGIAIGFVAGFSLGVMQGSSNATYIILFPILAIVVVFIALVIIARRIGKGR